MTDLQQLREENRRMVDTMNQELMKQKIEEQKKINEVTEKMLLEASEKQARFETEKRELAHKAERDNR